MGYMPVILALGGRSRRNFMSVYIEFKYSLVSIMYALKNKNTRKKIIEN